MRAAADRDIKHGQAPSEAILSNGIYWSSRMQFELRAQINMLKGMRLKPPFETLIPNVVEFYAQKIEFWRQLGEIASTFISDPKPDVDYGKLAASMAKIRAALDGIDESLFKASPLIFATLVDLKPDSKNHVSHLTITKAERAKLLDAITTDFGAKLDQKEQNFTVSAASVLKSLLSDFKSSDEPWE
jgi:hypothetical protein